MTLSGLYHSNYRVKAQPGCQDRCDQDTQAVMPVTNGELIRRTGEGDRLKNRSIPRCHGAI